MNNLLIKPTVSISVFIFRTNIKSKKKAKALKPFLNGNSSITRWTVDYEDIDNVLRIEAKEYLDEDTIISQIKSYGYHCEILTD
jgi:hypothetical protein